MCERARAVARAQYTSKDIGDTVISGRDIAMLFTLGGGDVTSSKGATRVRSMYRDRRE